jgi:hypothetical protein
MKSILLLWMTFILNAVISQNQKPVLKIHVDSTELKDNSSLKSLTAKIGGNEYSILNKEKTKIELPPGIDMMKIESVKFILDADTIVFAIDKLVSDKEIRSKTIRPDALETIFHSLKRWDLHVDKFMYYAGESPKKKGPVYKDYKIYALRTIGLSYYVVKL